MPIRTLALLGFSEQDILLLRSLLKLGEPLLKETWVLVPRQEAEVVLANSVRSTDTELAGSTAIIVTVLPPGSEPTPLPTLTRPLRVSPLVSLLNGFSPTLSSPEAGIVIAGGKHSTLPTPSSAQTKNSETDVIYKESITPNAGREQGSGRLELMNWFRTRLNWKGTSKLSVLPPVGSPSPLRLFAPTPRTFHNPSVELHERTIRKRLNHLPLLNLTISVPLLIEAVQGLSDEPLAARTRLQLLDLYREPINTLFRSFGTPILRKTSPLGGWEGNPSDPGRMFLASADGYKAIVLACCQEGATPVSDDLLLLGLWRALEQLAHALVHAYRYYRSLPPGVFLEAHQIFHYAVYWGVENHPLRCTHPGLGTDATIGTTSIADLYKQLLLLSISDPYSLTAEHLYQALEYLVSVAGKARFLGWKEAVRQHLIPNIPKAMPGVPCISGVEGLFIVDLEEDHPPLPAAQTDFSGATTDRWVIDTQPVLDALYQSTTAFEEEKGLQRRLAEQLTTRLRGIGQRREPRRSGKSEAILVLGIAEVHQTLSGGDSSVSRIEPSTWTVVNENSKSFMLNSPEQYQVAVGDLVGIARAPASEEGEWVVGVIRWLRAPNTGGTALGIELLTGTPAAAWCIAPAEGPQRCILQTFPGEEEVIAAPKGFYRRGIEFELHHQNQSRRVMASHLLQEESGFDQFELTQLPIS
ncbi:cyclic-di-GMP-binding protein [Gammaproteobacteria bacterium]